MMIRGEVDSSNLCGEFSIALDLKVDFTGLMFYAGEGYSLIFGCDIVRVKQLEPSPLVTYRF